MGIGLQASRDGVAEVTIDFPPVNALPAQGWLDLADAVSGAGKDPGVRAVILAAEGGGFCAGVNFKEMQRTLGHDDALIGANRGCLAAFATVYEGQVPVIAAVQGFCLGGGVGLAGSADIVIASDDATFGLPGVDRGALGAAAKQSLNGIEPVDGKRSYRYEQGCTFELNLTGVSDEAGQAFADRDRH